MQANSETHETTDASVIDEQPLALELAITALRRRLRDVSDRLYRELRPRGVYL